MSEKKPQSTEEAFKELEKALKETRRLFMKQFIDFFVLLKKNKLLYYSFISFMVLFLIIGVILQFRWGWEVIK